MAVRAIRRRALLGGPGSLAQSALAAKSFESHVAVPEFQFARERCAGKSARGRPHQYRGSGARAFGPAPLGERCKDWRAAHRSVARHGAILWWLGSRLA